MMMTSKEDLKDDISKTIRIKGIRQYGQQEWIEVQQIEEFTDVYLFNCLEEGIVWNSYYAEKNCHYYKCADKKCEARLKIVVKEEAKKEEEAKEQQQPQMFSSSIMQKQYHLNVPKLTIYTSNKHESHENKYKELVTKRFKDIGIHPLIKIIIQNDELFCMKPKEEIPTKHLPTKKQLSVFVCNTRKKQKVEAIVKNCKESIAKFVEDHKWSADAKDTDLICLESDLESDDFLIILTSKSLLKDKITRWKKPNKKKLLKENWGLINYAINLLHCKETDVEFMDLWKLIQKNWKDNQYPQEFSDYIEKNFINNRKVLRWNRMEMLGINLTNNSLERLHEDLKLSYTDKKRHKLNDFIVKCCTKFIRDFSIEHADTFAKPYDIPVATWRHALLTLKDMKRGPFYEIRPGFSLFIKKKRDLKDFDNRKEYVNKFLPLTLQRLYTKYYSCEIKDLPHFGAYVATFDYFAVYDITQDRCTCKRYLAYKCCKKAYRVFQQSILARYLCSKPFWAFCSRWAYSG